MRREELRQALEAAASGLQYPSESDEPFAWVELRDGLVEAPDGTPTPAAATGEPPNGAPDLEKIRTALRLDPAVPARFQEPEVFWQSLEFDPRFKKLQATMEELLGRLWVLRLGHVEVSIYIVGRLGKDLVGLQTLSVET